MQASPDIFIRSADALADEFARRVSERARDAIRSRGHFSIALSGGSIAPALLPTLGDAAIRWESVSMFWIDERAVPPDDPASNFGEARSLLAPSPASAARMYPMVAGDDLEASARAYEETLVRVLGTPPALDVVMLGVGDDGHVASLFPGHEQPLGRWVVAEVESPKPPSRRLTLTYETLAAARVIAIIALGRTKAPLIRTLLAEPASALPVSRVARAARELWLLLDEEAASLIGSRA